MKTILISLIVVFGIKAQATSKDIKIFGDLKWNDTYTQICSKLLKRKLSLMVEYDYNGNKIKIKNPRQCGPAMYAAVLKKIKSKKDPAVAKKLLNSSFSKYFLPTNKESFHPNRPIVLKSNGVRLGKAIYDLEVKFKSDPGVPFVNPKLLVKGKNKYGITAPLYLNEVSLKLTSGDSVPVYKSLSSKYKFTNGSPNVDYAYGNETKITFFAKSITYSKVDDNRAKEYSKAYKAHLDNQATDGKEDMSDAL